MKILFLETRQNEVWVSMQEILPHIKNVWTHVSSQKGWDLSSVDVDNTSPTSYRSEIIQADLIVIPAFNARVAQNLVVIRQMLGIQTPWVFYLHNQATIGLWPLFSLGIGDLLHKDDLFVGTCEGDKVALSRSINPAHFVKTYFATQDDLEVLPPIFKNKEAIKDIVFVGRISSQKNLHSLILAFKKLKRNRPELSLHIYGKEDGLGSPNMEWKDDGYQAFLNQIIASENIKDINFYGFVNRETIKSTWRGKPFVFCTASLHSDENFGMAALSALELGGRLVLTDWGGHKNFAEHFPERVDLVPVYHQNLGPFLQIDELQKTLEKSLNALCENSSIKSPFCLYRISQRLGESLENYFSSNRSDAIKVLKLTRDLVEKRKYFYAQDKKHLQKVFENYQDSNAQIFFQAYGATFDKSKSGTKLVPWAKKEGEEIIITDPIKREIILSQEEAKELGYFYSEI
ncbi:MAG: glycosyltransferase [Halobacteriovoraceae bacterium]|nr:glycosyltransferase [Halobacteriovoraceae bacterium]